MSEGADYRRKDGGGRGTKPSPPKYHHKGGGKSTSNPQHNSKPQRKPHKDRVPPPPPAPRSRSSDSERRGRSRGRPAESGHDRRQRGTSADPYQGSGQDRGRSRHHHNPHGNGNAQVSPTDDLLGETECPVCFCAYNNVFKMPKLLSCGHTFCLECLARINVTSPELKQLSCPVCREVTQLPHGRDLPQLGNNQAVFQQLPPEMQRAMSVRFKRSKGKLELKSKSTHQQPQSPTSKQHGLTLSPSKKKQEQVVGGSHSLGTVEAGGGGTEDAAVTSVDVGRPPNRMHGQVRRAFRSNQCYYVAVGVVVAVTVALMLVGILVFVVIPRVTYPYPPPGNHTRPPGQPGPGGGGPA